MMNLNELSKEELIKQLNLLNKELNMHKENKKYGIVWEETLEDLDKKDVIPFLEPLEELNIGNVQEGKLNYLIEGDNYHSLKVLKNTHQNKIDVIYIDPPYNTGNEFVYNDRIVDKKDKFRHSKWLSFMDKRLRLAKELMSDEGVIYISIDDNEQAYLKLLMDDIFGEENYLGQFIWRSTNGSNMGKNIVTVTEYILVYSKTDKLRLQGKRVLKASGMKYKDKHFKERGYYAKDKLDSKRQSNHYSESLNYPIQAPDGTLLYPGNTPTNNGYNWLWSKEKVEWGIINDFIIIEKDKKGEWKVYNKRYQKVDNKGEPVIRRSVIKNIIELSYASTSDGTRFMSDIGLDFDYTKPLNIIKDFISYHPNKNCTVLDFFAGSGTTGHAVLELNKEDGGNRNYILCTNNEVSEEKIRKYFINKGLLTNNTKSSFNKFKLNNKELMEEFYNSEDYINLGISRNVTRERIKKVIEGYKNKNGEYIDGIGGNLLYLKTVELNKENKLYKKYLKEFTYISHCLKYPNYLYNNYKLDNDFNFDNLKNNGHINTFLVDKDMENLEIIIKEIKDKLGNNSIIEYLDAYM